MKQPTHLSLFTGIGGIFTKEKGLLNEIALFRIKTYNAFIKKLACEVFEFAVIFPQNQEKSISEVMLYAK